jgi:hypothetical protein
VLLPAGHGPDQGQEDGWCERMRGGGAAVEAQAVKGRLFFGGGCNKTPFMLAGRPPQPNELQCATLCCAVLCCAVLRCARAGGGGQRSPVGGVEGSRLKQPPLLLHLALQALQRGCLLGRPASSACKMQLSMHPKFMQR